MSTREAIETIKSMLFGSMVPPQPVIPASGEMAPNLAPKSGVESKFEDYKLKSGAVVSIDKLDVGGSVTLDGAPAPDGMHELENGKVIMVSGGLITEVKEANGAAPVVEVEVEAMKKLPGMFSAIENGVNDLKKVVEDQARTIAVQQESLKQMFSLVEKIANNSIEAPKEQSKTFEEMTPLEKFRAQKG
jgi:competence protein ComGC